MTHENVARYWYDVDHQDCTILRQGDIFLNFLDDGRDYLVVVSQSCNLRQNPDLEVSLAGADELETWLAENGFDITNLDYFQNGIPVDRFMLPRRPGSFETELLVFLEEMRHVPASRVCQAVEEGFARARATDILTTVVGHNHGRYVNRPAIRHEIPSFKWTSSRLTVEPFQPGEPPFPSAAVPLRCTRYDGEAGTPRQGESWFKVAVQDEEAAFASTTRSPETSRRELAEQLVAMLGEETGLSEAARRAVARVRERYFG